MSRGSELLPFCCLSPFRNSEKYFEFIKSYPDQHYRELSRDRKGKIKRDKSFKGLATRKGNIQTTNFNIREEDIESRWKNKERVEEKREE